MGNGRLGGSVPEKPGRGEYAFAYMYVCVLLLCSCVYDCFTTPHFLPLG